MKVIVAEGWGVYHPTQGQLSGPAECEVDEDLAEHWISRGWASEVKAKAVSSPPAAKRTTPRR